MLRRSSCSFLDISIFLLIIAFVGSLAPNASAQVFEIGNRVVFLGDSNTYAGTWIDLLDAWQRKEHPEFRLDILNLGLSSETACGLSEPSHPFPRPNVHERIDRVLAKLKPDVTFVCYGMNDGIYHPFSQQRFEIYQKGLREVCQKIRRAGSKVVLLTPPPFDPLPLKKQNRLVRAEEISAEFSWQTVSDDYDQTIETYAKWVCEHGREFADAVVDTHTPLTEVLRERRTTHPDYAFSADGVHIDSQGHRLLAKAVLRSFGHESELEFEASFLELVSKRQRLLRDAYLTDIGHKRPGLPPGKPVEEAQLEAAALDKEISK